MPSIGRYGVKYYKSKQPVEDRSSLIVHVLHAVNEHDDEGHGRVSQLNHRQL